MRNQFLALGLATALACLSSSLSLAQDSLPKSETAIHTGDLYPTIPMSKALIGEDKPGHDGKHGVIHYFTPEEREDHRVIIVGGQVYDHVGAPYQAPPNKLMYVMDKSGNFYFFNQKGHEDNRHSSVFAGAPVAGAGEIMVVNGKVAEINRDSGHYSPPQRIFDNVMRELEKDGVDTSQVKPLVKKPN